MYSKINISSQKRRLIEFKKINAINIERQLNSHVFFVSKNEIYNIFFDKVFFSIIWAKLIFDEF